MSTIETSADAPAPTEPSTSPPSTSQTTLPGPQNARSIAQPKKTRPFPSITGGCLCNKIRYRLLTSPLFSHACHCPDCQRTTGSAFGHFLNIETYNIRILSPTMPVYVSVTKRPAQDSIAGSVPLVSRHVECPQCKTELWSTNMIGPMVADVRVGTLDFPSLMEPDVHAFVESKVDWLRIPENARTAQGQFKYREMWPETSLRRLEVCLDRWARRAREAGKKGGEGDGDGEKTPTANGEFGEGEGEDDEAFEKRYRETERHLQERLEVLRRKLDEQDGRSESNGDEELQKLTEKLAMADGKNEGVVEGKDGIPSEPVN